VASRFTVKPLVQPSEAPKSNDSLAPQSDLNEFLLSGPKFDDFDIERDPDTDRDIDLSDFV
jgi:hypothetical protein